MSNNKSFVPTHHQGEIETWTISRPERCNALGISIAKQLAQNLSTLEQKLSAWVTGADLVPPKPRVLVIKAEPRTISGQTIWAAGGDLQDFAKITNTKVWQEYAETMSAVCAGLEALPVPVISVISGCAIGGAAEFALAADIRIGRSDAVLDFRQLQVGMATGYGGAKRLVDLLGKARAQELLYGCKQIDAITAYSLGLLSKVAEADELEASVAEALERLVAMEPRAFFAQKRMFQRASGLDAHTAYEEELGDFVPLWGNETHSAKLDRYR